jgi:hypothetical protein
LVAEQEPDLGWDAERKRLVIRVEDAPSWKHDGTYYDYEIFLIAADIERICKVIGAAEQTA